MVLRINKQERSQGVGSEREFYVGSDYQHHSNQGPMRSRSLNSEYLEPRSTTYSTTYTKGTSEVVCCPYPVIIAGVLVELGLKLREQSTPT